MSSIWFSFPRGCGHYLKYIFRNPLIWTSITATAPPTAIFDHNYFNGNAMKFHFIIIITIKQGPAVQRPRDVPCPSRHPSAVNGGETKDLRAPIELNVDGKSVLHGWGWGRQYIPLYARPRWQTDIVSRCPCCCRRRRDVALIPFSQSIPAPQLRTPWCWTWKGDRANKTIGTIIITAQWNIVHQLRQWIRNQDTWCDWVAEI